MGEESIENADRLDRRQTLCERREVHHVGEDDGHPVELVGDRLRRTLQSLGDLARQDVQEECLRLLLFGSQRRQRRVALVGERGEDREGDGGRPMTFKASIVLVNHSGRSPSGNHTSPAMPVSRKTTTNATNHRTA